MAIDTFGLKQIAYQIEMYENFRYRLAQAYDQWLEAKDAKEQKSTDETRGNLFDATVILEECIRDVIGYQKVA